MRKDICYYYSADIKDVYSACKTAIKQKFKKDADGTPYHTLVFGLNFSFKYNMNGGGCHVHIMKYNDGTAIDIHYTIAQAVGARCEAHAKDLSNCVNSILQITGQQLEIDPEKFLENK